MLGTALLFYLFLQYVAAEGEYPLNVGLAPISELQLFHSKEGELAEATLQVRMPALPTMMDAKKNYDEDCYNTEDLELKNLWKIGWSQPILMYPFVDIYQAQIVGFEFYRDIDCKPEALVRRVDLSDDPVNNKVTYNALRVEMFWDLTNQEGLPLQSENGFGSFKLLFGTLENIGHKYVGTDVTGTTYDGNTAWYSMKGLVTAVQSINPGQPNQLLEAVGLLQKDLLVNVAIGLPQHNCLNIEEGAVLHSLHSIDYRAVMMAHSVGQEFNPAGHQSPVTGWHLYNSPNCVDVKGDLDVSQEIYSPELNYYYWGPGKIDISVFEGVKSVQAIIAPSLVPILQNIPGVEDDSDRDTDVGSEQGSDDHTGQANFNMGLIIGNIK